MKHRSITIILVAAASSLLVANTGTAAVKNWNLGGTDMNWSDANNWLNVGVPAPADDVILSNSPAVYSSPISITNSVVDTSFANIINTLSFAQQPDGTLFSVAIDAHSGLTVYGTGAANTLAFGCGTRQQETGSSVAYTAISGTSLSVTNLLADINIGQGGATGYSATRRAILDLTALGIFNADVNRLCIGYFSGSALYGGTVNGENRPGGALYLAQTNYITCRQATSLAGTVDAAGFWFGHSSSSAGTAPNLAYLGRANYLNINAMVIGGSKFSAAPSYMAFNPDFTNRYTDCSAVFRASDGSGRQDAFLVADEQSGYTASCTSTCDLSGGAVDALVDTIYVGRGASINNTANANNTAFGTLTYDRGTIDVNNMEVGFQRIAGQNVGKGVLNVNGTAILKINKYLRMANYLGQGANANNNLANASGTLNVNGGLVNLYGPILDGGGNSLINLSQGGTLNAMPAGAASAGTIAVNTLTSPDGLGIITNYSVLAVSNMNWNADFTVYPGEGLAAGPQGVPGLLTVNNNLILTNGQLYFDLGGTSGGAGASYDSITVNAGLTLAGTNSLIFNPLPGSFGLGTFNLVNYFSGLSGDSTNLKVGEPLASSRYHSVVDMSTPGQINLTVTGSTATDTWSGDGSLNVWNAAGATNWNSGTSRFFNLDPVIFDDTGSTSPAVQLVGTLFPASVTVNGTKSYMFAGSGGIAGYGGLTDNSTGTLTILTTNSYTGSTIVNAGTLQVGGATGGAMLGSGPVVVNSGTLAGTGLINGPATLAPGSMLAPGAAGIGTLTINNGLNVGGNVAVDVNASASPSSDLCVVSGTLTNSGFGTLNVNNTGPALAAGNTFKLFSRAVPGGGNLTIAGGGLGAGLTWTNKLAVDGTIAVLGSVALNPTNITFYLTNGTDLHLEWPADHLGWMLQMQTNGPGLGLSTNWVDVPGSAMITSTNIPIDRAISAAFYRLHYQVAP
jgi:autotransporter-associated beta strand protein